MKLCKIYSNKTFHNIAFHDGFNVILGKVSNPDIQDRDSHCLGKTLLIDIIDFLLLKQIHRNHFLKNPNFESYIFYCEIEINSGKFLIIKRAVENNTKISFKIRDKQLTDFSTTLSWDDKNIPFDKAKEKLNEYLGFDILPEFNYRKSLTYFLRKQKDFLDVYELDKFSHGKDKDWKPVVFDLLGFNGNLLFDKYSKEEERKRIEQKIETLKSEIGIDINRRDELKGIIEIKEAEFHKRLEKIDNFSFYIDDNSTLDTLIEKIDCQIQLLNATKYNLEFEIKRIRESIQNELPTFDIEQVKKLYEDIQIFFPDQLVKNYEDLISFNKSITLERNQYQRENLKANNEELERINDELLELDIQRKDALEFLTESDTYNKFKILQKEMAKLETEIALKKDMLNKMDKSASLINQISDIDLVIKKLVSLIRSEINKGKHSKIRNHFNQILKDILERNAIISISLNNSDNVEFDAKYTDDISKNETEEDFGKTYRAFLCIAFDLAILMNYSNRSFYRFVYHDGPFEGLDDSRKLKYIKVTREICKKYNIQYIITLIDSDFPRDLEGNIVDFEGNEVVLELDNSDDTGKLFKFEF